MKRERRGLLYVLYAVSDWLNRLDRTNYALMCGLGATGFGLLIVWVIPVVPATLTVIPGALTGLIGGWFTWHPNR